MSDGRAWVESVIATGIQNLLSPLPGAIATPTS